MDAPTFLSFTWCGLAWTAWIPLVDFQSFSNHIPPIGGVYRIRCMDSATLAYIGQSGHLYRRLRQDLAPNVYCGDMPWNDPHTAAPGLWAYRVEEQMTFACSVAPTSLDRYERKGLEDMLLWRYRLERGVSTLCNHGHFHARYRRPSNRRARAAMTRLSEDESNRAGSSSQPPLEPCGTPIDRNWMGLAWSQPTPLRGNLRCFPDGPALYKLLDSSLEEVIYVGETQALSSRMRAHARREWMGSDPWVSYHRLPEAMPAYQRYEWETDLLGAYYDAMAHAPAFQYGRSRGLPT